MRKFTISLSNIPEETKMLLAIMKMEENEQQCFPDHFKRKLVNMNWDLFLQLAAHHRVYPSIYKKVKALDEKRVPSYVVQTLKREVQKSTIRMLQLSGEMGKVAKQFEDHQIRTLFLKGPVLAHDLYGDISLRTSSDLDLLIDIHCLDQAETILINQGYIKDDYIHSVLNDWKWRHHHVTYFHPEKQTKIEIHWRLNPGPGKEPGFPELWSRKRLCTLTTTPIWILGYEDLFLFLVSHGARHGWSRLRWLEDICQLIQKKPDWHQIRKLLKTYQCLHVGGQAILLASHLLNMKIPEEMETITEGSLPCQLAQKAIFYLKQMVNLHSEPIPEDVARYHKRHLFSLMSVRQKLIFMLSFLYPYPKDAETLPLPKRLHFLYFPLRPFLLLWRKTRKSVSLGGSSS